MLSPSLRDDTLGLGVINPESLIVVPILFSIIPIEPQYNPDITLMGVKSLGLTVQGLGFRGWLPLGPPAFLGILLSTLHP